MMVRFGFQPCFSSSAERAHLLEHGARAGHRILGAVDPGVVMVAADDPFVRVLCCRESAR